MKYKILILFTIAALGIWSCDSKNITREDIEWSDFWWAHESDTTKPRVLFIGNSISRGYYSAVSERLSGIVNCDRYATSRSVEDPALLRESRMAMDSYNHVIIHFNNGLHGWHLTNEQYKKGLEKFVKFLKAKKSKDCILVYSLTTPYPSKESGEKLDPVNNQVVLDRNRIANEIMDINGIPVIDLYGLMEPELEKYSSSKGNVHYNSDGYRIMADKISNEIKRLLRQ